MLWQLRRTGQAKRFAAVFAEEGRGAEIRSILNMQLGSAWAVRRVAEQAPDEGMPPPDLAIAPSWAGGVAMPRYPAAIGRGRGDSAGEVPAERREGSPDRPALLRSRLRPQQAYEPPRIAEVVGASLFSPAL